MRYRCIDKERVRFSVDELCECFGLSRSGYYDWQEREPSKRSIEDVALKERITELHKQARGRYGHRPIYHHLQDEELDCGRDRTLRLMKEVGIEGRQKKGFKPLGTNSKHDFGYSPNLLRELGTPKHCDQVWVADTTYLKVQHGWCYLATVMDLYSRRIIGWKVSARNDSKLVCQALQGAVLTRGGELPKGLIHHSDRGSTYASYDYEAMLRSFGMEQSMSARGNCYDNAAQESFYGRYKTSTVGGEVFFDEAAARSNAFEYIEVFYNRFRKHSSLGYKSPLEFEEKIAPPMGGIGASLPACINHN
jgi:transposase InsO family protein